MFYSKVLNTIKNLVTTQTYSFIFYIITHVFNSKSVFHGFTSHAPTNGINSSFHFSINVNFWYPKYMKKKTKRNCEPLHTQMAFLISLKPPPPSPSPVLSTFLLPPLTTTTTTLFRNPMKPHHHHHQTPFSISFSTRNSPETDCPVPPDQQPINEYQSLSTSSPFSWASGDFVEYCSRLVATGTAFALFVGLPVSWYGSVGVGWEPLQRILGAVCSGIFAVTLAVVRMYLGWAYVGNRLLSATVECMYLSILSLFFFFFYF